MEIKHKLKDGKLIHEVLGKALDIQTAGEGYEWIPEGYARRRIKRVKIHRIDLNEMKELKKAKFLLRRHHWKGQFVVRGMPVDHWDLVLDKGAKCLDEFSSMENNPLDHPEGVSCLRKDCCNETPEGKSNKEWMKFYGKSIPPNHPEWGNPNKRIPSYMDKVDEGSVNIISDTDTFVSFMFHGKELKGYWIAKRESPKAEIWVFSKSSLPGEPRKTSQRKITKSLSQELKQKIKDFKGNILTEAERKFRLENFYKVVAATKDGTDSEPLDEVLIPYLEKINSFPFLITTQSCWGHNRSRDEKKAHFDFRSKLTEKDTIDKLIRPMTDKFCPILGCELMLECDRLRYCLWLDNKNWKQQFEHFISLLERISPEESKIPASLARHSREKCMECDAPPKYEVLWAEGIGRCWFCDRHFRAWALKNMKERKAEGYACDINMVREVQNGMAAKKWKENTNPDVWPKLRGELK